MGLGRAAVFPVPDVVGVEPEALGAQGVGAALVAAGEVAAHGAVGGALGGVDADELAEPVGHDLDLGVAGQEPGHRVGHDRAHVQLGGAEGAVGVDVDVQHDGVAFAALAGAPVGGVEGVGGFGGQAYEPVGPRHRAGARRLVRVGVGVGVGVGEVVAVAELGVAGAGQPEPHHGAFVGGEAEPAPEPAVAAVVQAQHPLGLGPRLGAAGLFGQGPQQPVELGDQQGRGQRRDLGVT